MSAVEQLRAAYVAGQVDLLAPSPLAAAILEVADQVVALNAKVFPPPPAATDPAVIAAAPIATDKPQLVGSIEVAPGGQVQVDKGEI